MKKKFVKPELKRIDLSLCENIAASGVEVGGETGTFGNGKPFLTKHMGTLGSTCSEMLVNSGISVADALSMGYGQIKNNGCFV